MLYRYYLNSLNLILVSPTRPCDFYLSYSIPLVEVYHLWFTEQLNGLLRWYILFISPLLVLMQMICVHLVYPHQDASLATCLLIFAHVDKYGFEKKSGSYQAPYFLNCLYSRLIVLDDCSTLFHFHALSLDYDQTRIFSSAQKIKHFDVSWLAVPLLQGGRNTTENLQIERIIFWPCLRILDEERSLKITPILRASLQFIYCLPTLQMSKINADHDLDRRKAGFF